MTPKKLVLGVAMAAGVAMTAGSAFSVNQPAADLMFPYVVSGQNVTTLLSVINTNAVTNLRFALNYKEGAGFSNADACLHFDTTMSTSPFDLSTIDVGGVFGATALFNDTVGGALGSALPAVPLRGYVSVWDPTNTAPVRTLQGDALVIDFNTGAAWGYRALSKHAVDFGYFTNMSNQVYLASRWLFDEGGTGLPIEFEVGPVNLFGPPTGLNVPFMPPAEVQTRFFVTPLAAIAPKLFNEATGEVAATALAFDQAQRIGDPGEVVLRAGPGAGLAAVYNRLEVPVSTLSSERVNCVGVVDLEALLGNSLNHGTNGGFMAPLEVIGVFNSTGARSGDNFPRLAGWPMSASVIKLEFGKTNTINGVSTGGTYNNAYQLRFLPFNEWIVNFIMNDD